MKHIICLKPTRIEDANFTVGLYNCLKKNKVRYVQEIPSKLDLYLLDNKFLIELLKNYARFV